MILPRFYVTPNDAWEQGWQSLLCLSSLWLEESVWKCPQYQMRNTCCHHFKLLPVSQTLPVLPPQLFVYFSIWRGRGGPTQMKWRNIWEMSSSHRALCSYPHTGHFLNIIVSKSERFSPIFGIQGRAGWVLGSYSSVKASAGCKSHATSWHVQLTGRRVLF